MIRPTNIVRVVRGIARSNVRYTLRDTLHPGGEGRGQAEAAPLLVLFAAAVFAYALWLMSTQLESYGASFEAMLGPAIPLFLLVVLLGIVGAVGLRAS